MLWQNHIFLHKVVVLGLEKALDSAQWGLDSTLLTNLGNKVKDMFENVHILFCPNSWAVFFSFIGVGVNSM
jgi:hypothetical protein